MISLSSPKVHRFVPQPILSSHVVQASGSGRLSDHRGSTPFGFCPVRGCGGPTAALLAALGRNPRRTKEVVSGKGPGPPHPGGGKTPPVLGKGHARSDHAPFKGPRGGHFNYCPAEQQPPGIPDIVLDRPDATATGIRLDAASMQAALAACPGPRPPPLPNRGLGTLGPKGFPIARVAAQGRPLPPPPLLHREKGAFLPRASVRPPVRSSRAPRGSPRLPPRWRRSGPTWGRRCSAGAWRPWAGSSTPRRPSMSAGPSPDPWGTGADFPTPHDPPETLRTVHRILVVRIPRSVLCLMPDQDLRTLTGPQSERTRTPSERIPSLPCPPFR